MATTLPAGSARIRLCRYAFCWVSKGMPTIYLLR